MVTSQRDVVFTPFMLRVRDTLESSGAAPTELRMKLSGSRSIAVAVDEWVELRTYAEHMIAEANAMLGPDDERIALCDECGDGVLAFELRRRAQRFRVFVNPDASGHRGQVEVGDDPQLSPEEPAERTVLDDLIVNMMVRAKQPSAGR